MIIEKAEALGITGEVIPKYMSYIHLFDEIEEWKEANSTDKNPTALKSEKDDPKKRTKYLLGKRIENLQNTFLKKYKDISYEEFLELPEAIQEIITKSAKINIGKKFSIIQIIRERMGLPNPPNVNGQSIGQAGFGSTVEECDKAQADLDRRVEELVNVKGVTQDE